MKLIADTTVDLPFKLDFCAQGPNVEPLMCDIGGFAMTMQFPPSLGETTDGRGIFGDWAWWTGMRLRLVMEKDVPADQEVEDIREQTLTAGDELLRRFLNAYRDRFERPDIFPVRIDPRAVELVEVFEDGTRRALPEPVNAFFYQTMPAEAPLRMSINSTTLAALAHDVQDGVEPELSRQLELDAEALDAQGEFLRAELVRSLARQQM
jgi:hypothetical protein